MSRRGVDSGALGMGSWIQDLPLFPVPSRPPVLPLNLLADEGGEGLHLQGGAHDDEEVHLREVLRGVATGTWTPLLCLCAPPPSSSQPTWAKPRVDTY